MAQKKGKKKSPLITTIVLVVAGYFIYSWYNDLKSSPPGNPKAPQQAVQSVTVPSDPPYSLQPTVNNWPPVAARDSKPFTDAEKLLTTNYYLMLDASGSMADAECSENSTKMAVAARAVSKFAQSLPAEANFGLAMFNGALTKELIPLGAPRDNVLETASAIQPTASTPLASAISFSYKKIRKQAQHQLGYGEYFLVLVTDGIANKGEEAGPVVDQILAHSPVQIYTIGFCISQNHSLNQPGRTVYRSANDPQSLQQGLQEVLAESPDFQVFNFKDGQ